MAKRDIYYIIFVAPSLFGGASVSEFIYRGRQIRSVSIFGLGRSGIGVLKYILKRHPHIKITLRDDKDIKEGDLGIKCDYKLYSGKNSENELNEDLIFLSPTIRRDRFPTYLLPRLTSDAELYFELTKNEVFGVTGSDGKSTTATLSSLLLSGENGRVRAIGNIGVPFLPQLKRGVSLPSVAELSSFQLLSFIPHTKRAVITNISENHLDFHKDMAEYIRAKENILIGCREPVFNYDDIISRSLLGRFSAYAVYSRELDYNTLKDRVNAEVYYTLNGGIILRNDVKIFDTGCLKTRNLHTVLNMLSAMALCDGYYTPEWCLSVGCEFSGLSHRCECVGVFSGITYINSSIDTTPTRTFSTLMSLNTRVTLILGGRDKGLSYAPLLKGIINRCSSVILTGESADMMQEYFFNSEEVKGSNIPIIKIPDFDSAVIYAIKISKENDTVLLSPATASYDSFSSFEERGERFKEIIRNHYYKRTI